ncbi:hypothetical protein ACLBVP_27065, partial [Pseudomonas aeruginosa]
MIELDVGDTLQLVEQIPTDFRPWRWPPSPSLRPACAPSFVCFRELIPSEKKVNPKDAKANSQDIKTKACQLDRGESKNKHPSRNKHSDPKPLT